MSLVLVLDSQWEPHRWVGLDDAMLYEHKQLVQNRLGETLFMYRGGTNRISGEPSKLETSSIIVLKAMPSAKKYREPILTNNALFARDRYTCAYCDLNFGPSELTRDHVMPVSKGGLDKWINVVTSCKICNNLKDDSVLGEVLPNGWYSPRGTHTMQLGYLPYIPCQAENMILRNRGVKLDQMEYLLTRIKNPKSRIHDYAKDYKKSGRGTWKELH